MPVKRDKDGKIVDEPTRKEQPACEQKTRVVGRKPPGAPLRYDKSTRKSGELRIRREIPVVDEPLSKDEPQSKTVVIRRPGEKPDFPAADVMQDPPVGWLVVVKGPGRGQVLNIGVGQNSIGRDRSERIALSFGDKGISRHRHGKITYDPANRKFLIQQGDGDNLIYINDRQNVLEATELAPYTKITLGQTVLRFVPLCGPDFDWSDTDE